jgi:hypothetical protein
MLAKEAIKLLQELPEDKPIMIQWFTQEDTANNLNTEISDGLWDRMMVIWDDNPATSEDFQLQEIKNMAEDDMFDDDEDDEEDEDDDE